MIFDGIVSAEKCTKYRKCPRKIFGGIGYLLFVFNMQQFMNLTLEQPVVKNPDQSIEQMLKEHGDVELVAFVRFEMGEGLQKRQDNFAEEVMGQMKK